MGENTESAARLRMALDLHEAAVEIHRQNLRRRHPEEHEDQILQRLRRWLMKEDEPPEGPWIVRRPQPT